ncbi:MAG: ATP-binding protein [Bacteroidales bacterium]|nr:ATP-binding protein [Bacteroidales bacterium]MBR6227079.1 ATP-binding protein [Bacteroidales bacterium]
MKITERNSYIKQVERLIGKGEAIILTGHRRAGKSCILASLAERWKNLGNIIFIDMEDPDHADLETYKELHDYVKSHFVEESKNFLLIDEVQEISQFEKALRYWIRQDNMTVVVTGSNAAMLSSEVATAFAGRYFDVHINSLNYEEFLRFYALQDSDDSLTAYLRWGGLPFLAQIPMADTKVRTDYLGSIYDTIFVKDVITRRKVRNVTMMDNLARFVADNTGKIFSANSIAKYLKGKENTVSANTVGEYMEAWCESYMIDKVKRYDIKGKLVFEQQEKYYFEDLGIRNYLCKDKRNIDIEKSLENIVYLKLKNRGFDVYVGQINGKEIDFVARRGTEMLYVQVSMTITNEATYQREFGNLKLIRDNYPKYLVTLDPIAALVNDSGIIACTMRDFLLRQL